MTSTSVSAVGLAIFTLLFITAAPVVAQAAPPPPASPGMPADASPTGDVAVLWLNVVKDGRMEMQPFPRAVFPEDGAITVDGYVNGVVLLSSASLGLTIDGKPTHPIRKHADGSYQLKYFGYLNRKEFWSTFHTDELGQTATNEIRSSYSSFSKIPGDVLSDAPELRISIVNRDSVNRLTIRQNRYRTLDVFPRGATAENFRKMDYLGDDPNRFARDLAAFSDRAEAIWEGIRTVEAFTGRRLVDRVKLIDFEGQHNAYTCSGESDIWVYSRLFWGESVEELRIIAAHEAMHILSDRLALPANGRIRELYADLMGFKPLSWERFVVMAAGRPPAHRSINCRNANLLFDFINEDNFLRGMKGGHAKDDVDEFCASFLHTLMYLDRLEEMVAVPIRHKNGSTTTLTPEACNRLLADYRTVLALVAEEMPRRGFRSLAAVVQSSLETADIIGTRLEARR